MDDCSPTHTFPNLHLRQPQPFHVFSPGHHSSAPGLSSAQPPLPLPTYHEGFPTLDPQQGEDNSVCDMNSLDEDGSMGGHFEGRPSWFGDIQKDDWNDNMESPADEHYAKANCYRGHGGLTSYNSCAELAYNRKGYLAKQATFYRDGRHSLSHTGLDDYGHSSASNEDQFQPLDIDTNPWLGLTGESRWRGELCATPQKPLNNRTYPQKLDSFSDAFLSQTKRRLPFITSADPQTWDNAIRLNSFDSDSLSPSLPSFPSPPTSNLLSPPPTPLPPASYSPSKVDSPSGGGLSVQGGEAVGTLQFFPARSQSLLSTNASGMVWRLPLLSHCFSQFAGDPGSADGNARASISGNNIGPNNIVQSLVPSSPHLPVLQSNRDLCPSFHSFLHTSSLNALTANHHNAVGSTVFRSDSQDPGCPVYPETTYPSMLQRKGRQKRAHYTPRPLLNPLRRGTGLYSSICHKEPVCEEERDESAGASPCINVGPDFQADVPPCSFDNWEEEWSCNEEESPREQLLWKPWDELCGDATAQDQVEKLLQMSSSSCLPGGGTNTELALHCLHRCHGDVMATLEMLLFSQPMPAGDYRYPGADVWTEREKSLFTAALETHGRDFSLIQTLVKTKTVAQCVEFYYLSKRLQDKQKTCKMKEEDIKEEEQPKRAPPPGQPITQQIRPENSVFAPSLASFFPCKLCGKMFYKIKSRNAHMKIHRQPQEEWTERKLQQQILNQALNRASSLIVQPQTLTFNKNNVTNAIGIKLIDSSVTGHSNLLSYSNSTSHVIPNINTGGVQTSQEPNSAVQFPPMWGTSGQTSPFYCSTEIKTETEEGTDSAKWK